MSFRCSTEWVDKLCYAVLTSVSATCLHMMLVQYHWLYSSYTFYPCDLFIAWLEAWTSHASPHTLWQPPICSPYLWVCFCLFVCLFDLLICSWTNMIWCLQMSRRQIACILMGARSLVLPSLQLKWGFGSTDPRPLPWWTPAVSWDATALGSGIFLLLPP